MYILALDGREGESFINDINKLLYMETLHNKWLEWNPNDHWNNRGHINCMLVQVSYLHKNGHHVALQFFFLVL